MLTEPRHTAASSHPSCTSQHLSVLRVDRSTVTNRTSSSASHSTRATSISKHNSSERAWIRSDLHKLTLATDSRHDPDLVDANSENMTYRGRFHISPRPCRSLLQAIGTSWKSRMGRLDTSCCLVRRQCRAVAGVPIATYETREQCQCVLQLIELQTS